MNRKEICVAVLMVALLAVIWRFVSGLDSAQKTAQTQFVYDAVHNAALTCYAVEGAYPDSLDYLRENYGLAYDQTRYLVTYSSFASNLIPEIYITEKEGAS